MHKQTQKTTKYTALAALIAAIFISLYVIPAFVIAQPGATPPSGNIDASFNTATTASDVDVGGQIEAGSGDNTITTAAGLMDITKLTQGTANQVIKMDGGGTNVTWATDTDSGGDITAVNAGTGISGGGTSGAVTINSTLGTAITTGEITDDEILEADLDATNAPTDNYVLSYDLGSLGFTWAVDAYNSAYDTEGEIDTAVANNGYLTAVTTGDITDDEILEADLDATNAPTDNYILSYDLASLGFTWVVDSTGTDTNAGTICGAGEFLNGDTTCDAGFLDADGVDDTLSEAEVEGFVYDNDNSISSQWRVTNTVNTTDIFGFIGSSVLTGQKDVFLIQDPDSGGGSQDESSSLHIYKSAAFNVLDDGSSALAITLANLTGNSVAYIYGRDTDLGTINWGIDADETIWTSGSILAGATGTNCGGTGAACYNSPTITLDSSGAATVDTIDTGSGAMDLGDAAVANGDTNSVPTGDQVYDFVIGLGYSTTVGDITEVIAGTGLTGGGASGSVTVNTGAGNCITVAADTVGVGSLCIDDAEIVQNSIDASEIATNAIDDAELIDEVYVPSGIRIGADSTNNEIDDASQGAASTALYIGNQRITTENIDSTGTDDQTLQEVTDSGNSTTTTVGIGVAPTAAQLHVDSGAARTAVYARYDVNNYGQLGQSSYGASGTGSTIGVYGNAPATTGSVYGVQGTTASTSGRGVRGSATAATGTTYGVTGNTASSTGYGVFGSASSGTGSTFAVAGNATSTSGTGIYGLTSAATGTTYAVRGLNQSSAGYGGYFANTNVTSGVGIYATSIAGQAAILDGDVRLSDFISCDANNEKLGTNASGDIICDGNTTGTMSSFTLAGTGGANQTITNGNTLTIAQGSGITTTGGATDTVTIAADQTLQEVLTSGNSGGNIDMTAIGDFTTVEDIIIPLATSGSAGVIYKGASRFIHNYGTRNTFLGVVAGNLSMTGTDNTAMGYNALDVNTTGTFNTGMGSHALGTNTTGTGNTALGSSTLTDNLGGTSNVAVGSSALTNNISGNNNVAIGRNAGSTLSTGSGNIFIGMNAGSSETGSNTLYIDGGGSATPLIGGDFLTNQVDIVDALSVSGLANCDTINTNGSGLMSCGSDATNDNDDIWIENDTVSFDTSVYGINFASGFADATTDGDGIAISIGAGTGISVAADAISATLGTSISGSEIINGTIEEVDLEETSGTPTEGDILTFDNATGGFTWDTCTTVTGSAALCDGGDATNENDDIAIEEDNVSVDGSVYTVDFGDGLDVAADGANEVNVIVDCVEVTGSAALCDGSDANSGGTMSSFSLAGTSGTPQTITDGNTLTVAAGTGITTTAAATDTVTVAATLGTSIISSEIVNGTIQEADLEVTNAGVDNWILSYDSASLGFTWVVDSTGTDDQTLQEVTNQGKTTDDDITIDDGGVATKLGGWFNIGMNDDLGLSIFNNGVGGGAAAILDNGIASVEIADAAGNAIDASGDIRTNGNFYTTQHLYFDGELKPDGATCSDTQILKRTAANNWDCVADNDTIGANTALSNLASVAVNTSLISDTDIADDLGSAAKRWRDLYLGPTSLKMYSETTATGGGTNDVLGELAFTGATGTAALNLTTTNAGTATGGNINLTSAHPAGGTTDSAFNITTTTNLNSTDELLQIGDSGGTFMTVRGTGNVGIGTSAPSQLLDVVGNIEIPATTASTGIIYADGNTFAHNFDTGGTFLGIDAGNLTGTGNNNTGLGAGTLDDNTTGSSNIAVGSYALDTNTTASNNIAMGYNAMGTNTTGATNIAIGSYALDGTSTGASNNVAVGYQALGGPITGGTHNVAIGSSTLDALTTGDDNIAIGNGAFGALTSGQRGVAIGIGALGSNTTAHQNVAIGALALNTNSTGSRNIAIGYMALQFNATTNDNTAIGYNGARWITGARNTALGSYALDAAGAVNDNTAVGYAALGANTAGANTAVGSYSQSTLTTGTNNTSIGYQSGYSNSTGTGNVFIGYQAGYSETGGNNLYIDNTNTTDPLIYGDFTNNEVGINTGSPTASVHVLNTSANDSFRVDDSTVGESTPFIIDADGDVGIGITALSEAKLNVYDTDTTTTGNASKAGFFRQTQSGIISSGTETVIGVEGNAWLSAPPSGGTVFMRGGNFNANGQDTAYESSAIGVLANAEGATNNYGMWAEADVAGQANSDSYGIMSQTAGIFNSSSTSGEVRGIRVDNSATYTGASTNPANYGLTVSNTGSQWRGVSFGARIQNSNANGNSSTTSPKYGMYILNTMGTTTSYQTDSYGLSVNNTDWNAVRNDSDKYGIYVTSFGTYTGGAGTTTNNYGLYVDTVSGADTNWSIYAADGLAPSYFAANVLATPIVGMWYPTAVDNNNGYWDWDGQGINTNTSALSWSAGGDYITVDGANYPGYYKICWKFMYGAVAEASYVRTYLDIGGSTKHDTLHGGTQYTWSTDFACSTHQITSSQTVGLQSLSNDAAYTRYGSAAGYYSWMYIYKLN